MPRRDRAAEDSDLFESSKVLTLLRLTQDTDQDLWLDSRILAITLHRVRRDLESSDGSETGRLLYQAKKAHQKIKGLLTGFWKTLLKDSKEKIGLLPAFGLSFFFVGPSDHVVCRVQVSFAERVCVCACVCASCSFARS